MLVWTAPRAIQVPLGRPILKNKYETSRASKLEVSPNRLLALILAGVGMLNHEPHKTLPTVPYGPSGFSGMVEPVPQILPSIRIPFLAAGYQ